MNDIVTTKTEVSAATNDLGFKILGELEKKDSQKNIFIAPASIAAALTMTYNGACQATAAAMSRVLGLDGLSRDEVNEANAALLAALERPDPKVKLIISNAL